MTVSGLQKLTLLDFPGKTACIIFTRDCNFRCPFCHNADLVIGDATPMDNEEIFAYLDKRKKLLDGVVITGGEPLLQKDIADFIRRVKSYGYAVKLDTNGTYPDRLRALLDEGLVDYVAMDIKNGEEEYLKTAGVSNEALLSRVKDSVSLIMSSGVPYEFRTTVVKGLHTKESLLSAFAMIKGAERYFLQGFVDSGALIDENGLSAFSKAEMQEFVLLAKDFVKEVSLRGYD